MPGILPMKVIKVGTSPQARVAQACDRCRSKKIRCDGLLPTCSPCASVGFECKTSDKLSRRAFPRGYTETLEERIRCLEAEIRELKELLDQKDEKLDVLSRLRSYSPRTSTAASSAPMKPSPATVQSTICSDDADDLFNIPSKCYNSSHQPDNDPICTGPSTLEVLGFAVQTHENSSDEAVVSTNLHILTQGTFAKTSAMPQNGWLELPRLHSDRFINIYFQEWAPLLPILHKPTALRLYDRYASTSGDPLAPEELTQLLLVFDIAARSSRDHDENVLASIESQWRASIMVVSVVESLPALQCLILAMLSALLSSDRKLLCRMRALAVNLSERLGLLRSPVGMALDSAKCEIHRKLFWSLYTLDCFTAAQTGMARAIVGAQVTCELPIDAHDESPTVDGVSPSLPGSSKISTAIALFRFASIFAKVLDDLYPSSTSTKVSLSRMAALDEELTSWHLGLPTHLRLQFVSDRPSTNVVHNRSPILTLAYHYLHTLIHRPALLASTELGDRATASIAALASSSKPIVQILKLLDERGLSLALPIERSELLVAVGLHLLPHSRALDKDSKLRKCYEHTLSSVIGPLEHDAKPKASLLISIAAETFTSSAGASSNSRIEVTKSASSASWTQNACRTKPLTATPQAERTQNLDTSSAVARHSTAYNHTIMQYGSHNNVPNDSALSSRTNSPLRKTPGFGTSAYQQHNNASPTQRARHSPSLLNLDYLSFDDQQLPLRAVPALSTSPVDACQYQNSPSSILFAEDFDCANTNDWDWLINLDPEQSEQFSNNIGKVPDIDFVNLNPSGGPPNSLLQPLSFHSDAQTSQRCSTSSPRSSGQSLHSIGNAQDQSRAPRPELTSDYLKSLANRLHGGRLSKTPDQTTESRTMRYGLGDATTSAPNLMYTTQDFAVSHKKWGLDLDLNL